MRYKAGMFKNMIKSLIIFEQVNLKNFILKSGILT